MSRLKRFVSRLGSFLRPARAERELAREIAAHRLLLEDDLTRRGKTAEDARLAATRAFVGLEASKERQRDERSFGWLEDLPRDIRYAARVLVRHAGFTTVAILTLALAIGINSALFTVVRSVLLRPLPYPQADRLVFAYDGYPGAGVARAGTSVPNYLDRRAAVSAFESQALYQFRGFGIGEPGSIEAAAGMAVTPSFFHVLQVSADRGRLFTEAEGESGHEHVAILSFEYARRAFGDEETAVGRAVRLNGERYAVIGVMPEGFAFLNPDVRVWIPDVFTPEQRAEDSRYGQSDDSIARLAPGATLAQAQQQVDALTRGNIERAGPLKSLLINTGYHSVVVPLAADMVRNVRGTLNLLWGGVLFVLLIATANITNLVLVRASSRTREMATRHALGAGRGRMARQLLAEMLLLTAIGGLAGSLLGAWTLRWVSSLGLAALPRGHEIRMDWAVVAFTFALACVQGVIISAAPLAQLAGLNLNVVLREDGRTGTAGRGAGLVRRALVTVQVALAFMLLIGAGLLFASFRQLLSIDPGFKAEHVLTGSLDLPESRYGGDAKRGAVVSRALERIRRVPGVVAAGVTSDLPFNVSVSSSTVIAEGYVPAPGESILSPRMLRVTPGYFEALGVPLKRGRYFADRDSASGPRAIIIDERLARKFWPHADPIGRRMFQPERASDLLKSSADTKWLEVVGVVGAVKQQELVEADDPGLSAFYLPYAQATTLGIGFVIKTQGEPAAATRAVQQALRTVDPELQLGEVKAMPERIEGSLHPRRTPMLLSLGFGLIALLLASLGIYGVLAYQVSQRTREIGIRMALGSDARSVLHLVLREGAVLVLIGLAVGLAGAVALRSVIASQLYGVGVLDPIVLVSVSGVLAMAALLACLVPARRAARVDPVVALAQQ
jgi:putative ABC transport system permease protein